MDSWTVSSFQNLVNFVLKLYRMFCMFDEVRALRLKRSSSTHGLSKSPEYLTFFTDS